MPWRARTIVDFYLRRRASRPQLKRDPLASRELMRFRSYYLLLGGLAIACGRDNRLTVTRTAFDSLTGERFVGVIISNTDPVRQYAFAATARWDGTRLWLTPMPSGRDIVVPIGSDGHPLVFELTGRARQILVDSSEHAGVMTRLAMGARFAAILQGNSIPSGATPVPGLVAMAIVPGWHR